MIDFDVNAENIEKSEPISYEELLTFQKELGIDLPPSFFEFKKKYADSFYISTGNVLEIFPLCKNKTGTFTNIVDITKDYAHIGNILMSHKLLIFGMSGVDSETWAFYVNKKYPNGEYPILWISPGEEIFFFHSTNFESFINIQYKVLTTDIDEGYDEYYQAQVEKYDKDIKSFGYDSIYSKSHSLKDLHSIMSEI